MGGSGELGNGRPLAGDAARRLACNAGYTRIIVRGTSEVLDVGRKTRHWNRAQRRAIRYRHRNRCAFPGCDNRILQIHHCDPWGDGGHTDLDVGVPLCWAHHHLVHDDGWTVTYDPHERRATFTSRTGRVVHAPARSTAPVLTSA